MKNKVIFVALLKCAGSIVGTWCTVLQVLPLMKITPPAFMHNIAMLLLVVFFAILVYSFYLLFREIRKDYRIRDSEKSICIRIGNILRVRKASILIGVNDELTCTDNRIGENSIHRKLMRSKNGKNIELLFEQAKKTMQIGEKNRAPYGYAFANSPETGEKDYIFLVMSTIYADNNIRTSPENLAKAIRGFFDMENELTVKNGCVHMPIIGSGPAGVSLTMEQIIRLIACEYVNHSLTEPSHQITRLAIQIRWKDIHRVNIMEIVKAIAWMTENCCCLTPLQIKLGASTRS
jgi:hypothetical protein